MTNREWLLQNAEIPIRYAITRDPFLVDGLLSHDEVSAWMQRLSCRVALRDLSDIHGSDDGRYDTIMRNCFIYGLNASIPPFDSQVRFFIDFLNKHITKKYDDVLTFWKMYAFRDYETILACYLPFMGYFYEPSVQYVVRKRLQILYDFTKQRRYDVCRQDLDSAGIPPVWRSHVIDPSLYEDGNIALPSLHDYILLAGAYAYLSPDEQQKAETIVQWLFGNGYEEVYPRFYYHAPHNPSYKAKAINGKVDISGSSLFLCFILSHYASARHATWFSNALSTFQSYQTKEGRFRFPPAMLGGRKGEANVGEPKGKKQSSEILSTYWMERILSHGGDMDL
ncbi:MAG: hypothetical protein RR482_04715 [Clostridia bacterium]